MGEIPENPIILFSWLNTQLRDKYNSFDELCEDLQLNGEELEKKLRSAGFTYQPELNQFR